MNTIEYYKVSFGDQNRINGLMQEKNFETWDGAMNYMEGQFKDIIKFLSTRRAGEDIISDYVRENPFQEQLTYTRQLVVQNKEGFCRIYSGRVEKEWIHLF